MNLDEFNRLPNYNRGLIVGLHLAQQGHLDPAVPADLSHQHQDFKRGFGYAVRAHRRNLNTQERR